MADGDNTHDGELLVDGDERRVLDTGADHAEEKVKAIEGHRRVNVRRCVNGVVAQDHEERDHRQNAIPILISSTLFAQNAGPRGREGEKTYCMTKNTW